MLVDTLLMLLGLSTPALAVGFVFGLCMLLARTVDSPRG